jgi:uncharacterized RDD family membrane protein YckC
VSFCAQCGHPVNVAQLGPVHVPPSALPPEEIPARPSSVAVPAHALYAGFWLRAVAFFIDIFILSFLFTFAHSISPSPLIILPDPDTPLSLSSMLSSPFTLAGFLVLFFMMWLYYAAFEASAWQATPGQRVMKF